MNNLAIIPARGGSKRIPKKNIKDFMGMPIMAYSIKAAVHSGLFSEVMVSTDNEQIKKVAKKYGAEVPFMRSAKNSDDFATLNDVFLEVKEKYTESGRKFDYYCIILPTAPLLHPSLLHMGFELLHQSDFDSIRPVVQFEYPIQRAFRMKNSKVEFFYPEHERTRSQDLEKSYHDAGLFYFIREGFDLTGKNKGAMDIDRIYAQDIDDEDDWTMAELKFKYLYLEE